MDKKSLSERDICTKFITPALEASGWDKNSQFLEEVNLTSGRVVVRGNKTKRDEKTIRRADYALYYKPGIPIAVVEATRVTELRALCAQLREHLVATAQTQSRLAATLIEKAVA